MCVNVKEKDNREYKKWKGRRGWKCWMNKIYERTIFWILNFAILHILGMMRFNKITSDLFKNYASLFHLYLNSSEFVKFKQVLETRVKSAPFSFFTRTLNWDSRWERGALRSSGFLGCSCGAPVFWRVSRCGKEMSSFQHTEYSSYALRYTSFLHSVHYGSVKGDNLRPLATAVKHAAL